MSRRHREAPAFPQALVIGAVVTLGAGWGAWAMMGESPPTEAPEPAESSLLEFPPLEFDVQALKRQRAEKYDGAREALQSDAARKDVDELHELVRRANKLQFQDASVDGSGEKLTKKISVTANRVVTYTGFEGFVAAGGSLYSKCQNGLTGLLRAIRGGGLALKEAKETPPRQRFGDYRANCGRVLPMLLNRGLVVADGRWAEPAAQHRRLFDLLQRYRWASIISDRKPPLEQLTEEGRRVIMRWRIESDAYPLEARRRFLERVAQSSSLLPDYDTVVARARLEVAAGNLGEAVSHLRSVLQSEDPKDADRYRRMLRVLESRIAGG